VFHYDLATGRLIKKYVLPLDLMFNDLDVTAKGDVFADGHAGRRLSTGFRRRPTSWRNGGRASSCATRTESPISSDQRRLFISTFPDGVTVIDLESGSVRGLAHPAGVSLASIDGCISITNSLDRVQNGCIAHRVARFFLNPARDSVLKAEVLGTR